VYDLRKYETYQWWYAKTFSTPAMGEGERIELVFDGLDCIAEIWLNGKKIGAADNMFIQHRFDITDGLRGRISGKDSKDNRDRKDVNDRAKQSDSEVSNELYVRIFSPILEGRKYTRESLGTRSDAAPEAVNIRKAAHQYGWDILPRIVSGGIWRDAKIEVIYPTRWKSVYWAVKAVNVSQKTADALLDWEFASDRLNIDDLKMRLILEKDGAVRYDETKPVYTTCGRWQLVLKNAELWWPRSYGAAALYNLRLQLLESNGAVIDEFARRVGVRKAELIRTDITTPEQPGEFVFKVNGEKIFVRGTNWVPLDALHSRDREWLPKVFPMVTDLNCNMIRCWGGNVYESDEFFDLCDENGVMVWQDFAMACTLYPQNSEFAQKIEKEARSVVLRLRNHPSLVLWAGNNENDASLRWGSGQEGIDPNSDVISRQVLPSIVRQFDPLRPYLPSSPYCGPELFKKAGIDESLMPEVHLWGPRGYYKAPFYTKVNAHFVSEIGYHGCPSRESIEQMMAPAFVYPWTPDGKWNGQWQAKAVNSHPLSTAHITRNDLMTNQIISLFGESPKDLDKFILASQIVQAEAKKYFIEMWRMDKFRKTGIIWWNLRDGWPILSDAIVDYYNRKKLAYDYIKRVQTDVCVMIGDTKENAGAAADAAKDSAHPIVVVNDTRTESKGSFTVKDASSNEPLFSGNFTVPANGKITAGTIPKAAKQSLWLIEWRIGESAYHNHYLAGEPPFNFGEYSKWQEVLYRSMK
ncbi:MAG: glycoside hydrolase family 2, partial [Candidatus Sumerlaeota bacterium]|nr:glycoside hydrolase family 2 [Candidatus Sumerlaeota bacterium]